MSVCVLGSINLDIVASVAHLPRAGETVLARIVDQFPGGKGANQAVAAARMGADTLIIGAVGADEAGNRMRSFLDHAGVNVSGIKIDKGHATGQAYINVSSTGENSIVVAPGANGALSPEDILPLWLNGRRVFLSQLEIPPETIAAFFSSDAARAGTAILNPAPARPEGLDLFPLADVIIVNETELATYAGLLDPPPSTKATVDAARRLICRDGQAVIVTLGAQGAAAVERIDYHLVPCRRTQVVDTTGAGDCFCGAFAAGLAEGLQVRDAIKLAVMAASISVERAGAGSSVPTRAEVDAIL